MTDEELTAYEDGYRQGCKVIMERNEASMRSFERLERGYRLLSFGWVLVGAMITSIIWVVTR